MGIFRISTVSHPDVTSYKAQSFNASNSEMVASITHDGNAHDDKVASKFCMHDSKLLDYILIDSIFRIETKENAAYDALRRSVHFTEP
jgi:cAMP phosphodiesterase